MRYVEGCGVRTPDFGHRCTDFVKNRHFRPLQGGCLCGSLAKTKERGGRVTRWTGKQDY